MNYKTILFVAGTFNENGGKRSSVANDIVNGILEHELVNITDVFIYNGGNLQDIIPCGAIEEFYEIINVISNKKSVNFAINLRGHGSIVFADNVEFLNEIDYSSRPFPEKYNP
ncbi:hypothetical protein CMI47_13140 [Candidatus Pacearchaeota archaeon]|nr:hypothetical protein [Candidatus Pacearchaeota archaeon]|tara:strand:+ start:17443 stop:17781 length:339 start_codon:yes stop_codon:yes gene_type:complete